MNEVSPVLSDAKKKKKIITFSSSRRFLEIDQSKTRIACGSHIC
jgi:hypothetical protein